MKLLWIGGCGLALIGGVMVGRASSARSAREPAAVDCSSVPRDAPGVAVTSDAPRGASTGSRPTIPALPRAAIPVLTPWETLVVDQPEATELVQQAVQARMSDMSWARALHECTRDLGTSPSRARFTATLRNDSGALTIVDWSSHVLEGPDVPAGTLACVAKGLPTGPLELSERWPGAAPTFEYDLEMSLER